MNTSFYNGISGTKTHQFGLDVWADNISNVNTVGYKNSTPEFSTVFATTLSNSYFQPAISDIGLGSRPSGTALDTTQGIFQNTDRTFDLAIGGDGWFGVQGLDNQLYYTRAGNFGVNSNGDMVNEGGYYLLGSLGGNITPTSLSPEKLEQFGRYYGKDGDNLGEPYAISYVNDIPLGAVENQTKINLPDILYLPAEPTTYVNYQANLDPKIEEQNSYTNINEDNNIIFTPTYPTASISGTMANNTDIENLKEGDKITIVINDNNNKQVTVETRLDANLNFSVNDINISDLDENSIKLGKEIKVTQEIPNVEHFTTEVISPDGEKNFIDMTFTKRVPQESLETTWDAKIELLSFYEDYIIETYDPTKTYDPEIYNVDLEKGIVTKIYNPLLYKVDTKQNRVYEIIDSQTGDATFRGDGGLKQSNMPTLSNSGVPLELNIGEPYEEMALTVSSTQYQDGYVIFSGNSSLDEGEQVLVRFTDSDGFTRVATGRVNEDGSWEATTKYSPTDPTIPATDIEAYNIVHSGYEGMISHVDLDKARMADKDGYVEGILKDYGMDTRGNVIAEFNNGRSIPVAKVAIYHFQNDQGLEKTTSTLFKESANSGKPIFYTNENGEAILGSQIFFNKLEGSNVNLATALTELIVIQKAFNANAKSITTSDQMIQNAINMKK